MRIIEVNLCSECPYLYIHEDVPYGKSEWCCGHQNRDFDNFPTNIPNWCLLKEEY